jgi:hypothetical protein
MLIGSLGLFDLLLQRLTGCGDFHEFALLYQLLILLLDQFGFCVEISDVVAILDLHRLASDRCGFF